MKYFVVNGALNLIIQNGKREDQMVFSTGELKYGKELIKDFY